MALTGKYWPVHPKPLKDEIFSSWLVRTAKANSPRVHTFCHLNWPGVQIWNRDIDKYGYQKLIAKLSRKNGVCSTKAGQTTLISYEGTVFEQLNWKSDSKWILPVGVFHRKRKQYGLQWCPGCLSEDSKPYYRKAWRLAFASCCTKHRILLANQCEHCHMPATPHRSGFINCDFCDFDYRDATRKPAEIGALQFEHWLHELAVHGCATLPRGRYIHSIAYFDIIYRLMSLLAYGSRSNKLRTVITQRFGGDPRPVTFRTNSKRIEYLSPSDRHRITGLLSRIIIDWPFRFVEVCKTSSNWASWVLKDMQPVRFQLWEPAKRYLSGPLTTNERRNEKHERRSL